MKKPVEETKKKRDRRIEREEKEAICAQCQIANRFCQQNYHLLNIAIACYV